MRRPNPAEFLDDATACNDCGSALVGETELGSETATRAASAWRDAREVAEAPTSTADSSAQHRLDGATGLVLIGLSVVLLVGSYTIATSMEGGKYFISIGPFLYGVVRLGRGLSSRS